MKRSSCKKTGDIMIKRILYGLIVMSLFSSVVAAQGYSADHAEFGVYADYFRLNQTGTNLAGVGARLSVNTNPYLQLEAQMGYDFEQGFTETFRPFGGSLFVQRSDLRLLHGSFGPKLQTPGPVRLFVTAKGGFDNFGFSNAPATLGTFTSTVSRLRADNVNAVFYPGGGVETFLGPIGLRLDVGDEIYFNHGANHNFSLTFGPTIRF
jgi:hypothetical protein